MTRVVIDIDSDNVDFGWFIEQIGRMLPNVKIQQIPEE